MRLNLSSRLQAYRECIPYFVGAIALLFTAAAASYVAMAANDKERLQFENAVQKTEGDIQERVETYIALVRASGGLFATSEDVIREEFRAFVNRLGLRERYPGVQGIGFTPRVPPEAKATLEAQMRQQGLANFSIRPNFKRREYFPIVYLEPLDRRNWAAIGFDMFSDPVRRAAMERARDTGTEAASGKVTLVQEIGKQKQAGFLIYLPVYRNGNIPSTVAERRANLLGFVYSPFRADDLIKSIFDNKEFRAVDFQIYDGSNVNPANLLHSSYPSVTNNPSYHSRFSTTRNINVAGQPWSIVFTSRPELELTSERNLVPYMVLTGVGMSLILFGVTRSLTHARNEAQRSAVLARSSKTDRAKAETALHQSEERYRAFIEQSSEGIWRFELEQPVAIERPEDEQIQHFYQYGYLAECNNVMAQMYGFSSTAEIVGARLTDLLVESEQLNIEYLRSFIRSGYKLNATESYEVDKEGKPKYFLNNLVGIVENGFLVRAWGTQLDVTERKKVQEALRTSEERYRSLVEATAQIIWNTDASGALASQQDGWSAFTGQTFDELKGWGWLNAIHPEDRDRTAQLWSHAIANRTLYQLEHRLRRYDGEYRYMSVRAVPLLETDGSVREWVGVHTDITQRKQAEMEREKLLQLEQAAREEAERVSRIKDEFLATLSHELRTPLNAMMGWTQLLRSRKFNEETTARALETIDRNTKSLSQLIEDILDMSRIIRGKLHLDVRTVEIIPIIEAAIETVLPAAQAKDITIQSVLEPATSPVLGDINRLQQVFWNLLANAVKFTPKGGRVEVRLQQLHSQVQIKVIDNGQGISPEFLPHVFERFRQADSTTTRSHGGLGLGLAIVRHLVELHGGTVQAESQGLGKGATFTVNLPIKAVVYAEPKQLRSHAVKDEETSALPVLEGLRVLVVDDEADARDLVSTALTQYGAQVVTAAAAKEAVAAITQFKPHVLISDIGMPDEDGYSLIRQVRALTAQQGGQIPAVALTAYARAEDRQQVLAAGFQLHVSKPVNPSFLAVAVSNLAEQDNS